MNGTSASSMRRFIHHWFQKEIAARVLKVAGVVGSILTAIKLYAVLLYGDFSFPLLSKILLTFFELSSVSAFSSAREYMDRGSAHFARERVGVV